MQIAVTIKFAVQNVGGKSCLTMSSALFHVSIVIDCFFCLGNFVIFKCKHQLEYQQRRALNFNLKLCGWYYGDVHSFS